METKFENPEILEFINSEVPTYQREILIRALESNSNLMDFYDNIGKELTGETAKNNLLLNTGPIINKDSFWDKVKKEVYDFICTKSRKYSKERNLLGKEFKQIVTIISTAIASSFSIGIGVVVGIVTTIILSIIKVGQNAWCELQKDN